jgi:hypothetical protein
MNDAVQLVDIRNGCLKEKHNLETYMGRSYIPMSLWHSFFVRSDPAAPPTRTIVSHIAAEP